MAFGGILLMGLIFGLGYHALAVVFAGRLGFPADRSKALRGTLIATAVFTGLLLFLETAGMMR